LISNQGLVLQAYFDEGDETMATMINEGRGYPIQQEAEEDTQSVPISIDNVPFFEDELAGKTTGRDSPRGPEPTQALKTLCFARLG
jgi:hypothetical protein